MVNGINSQSNIYALKDLVNLAKYANGVPLTDDAEKLTVSQVSSYPTMMCAYEGYQWVKENKGQYKKAFKSVTDNGKTANDILKKNGVKGVLRVADAKEVLANIPTAEALNGLSAKTQDLYKNAQKLAEAVKANPSNKDIAKQASQLLAKAEAASYAEMAKGTGLYQKFKNAVGITKVGQATRNMAAKSSTFKTCLDAYNNESGNAMLVLEGGVEALTTVVPTFRKLGFKRGMKQLGRSAVRVVSSVAGWVAGSAVGSKIGEVVGALVGNTKVGAVVGAIAGRVGSYAVGTVGQHYANKAVTKVLGKSELEKAKEEDCVKIAQAAQQDPEVFDALIQQAAERLVNEGEDTAESKAVNQVLRNLVAQKDAAGPQESRMMTREEMKAYADKLADNTVSNPIAQQTTQAKNNKSGYTGYIPSSDPAPIKPEPQQAAVAQNAQQTATRKAVDEMTPEMKALLARADRVIKNGSRYLDLK